MATIPSASYPRSVPTRPIFPLTPGERLTREEFLTRYAAMPAGVKAERIQGKVYVPAAAVSAGFHGDPHAKVLGWLVMYEAATPGVTASDNTTVFLNLDNDPQPDAFLRILPAHGGSTTMNDAKYIEGAPELIVEVTASSISYDLGAKLDAHQGAGVR